LNILDDSDYFDFFGIFDNFLPKIYQNSKFSRKNEIFPKKFKIRKIIFPIKIAKILRLVGRKIEYIFL
jgi:hypothetical protein